MEIKGSNAIMVGGASGMCRATAEKFAERGGNVAILDLVIQRSLPVTADVVVPAGHEQVQ